VRGRAGDDARIDRESEHRDRVVSEHEQKISHDIDAPRQSRRAREMREPPPRRRLRAASANALLALLLASIAWCSYVAYDDDGAIDDGAWHGSESHASWHSGPPETTTTTTTPTGWYREVAGPLAAADDEGTRSGDAAKEEGDGGEGETDGVADDAHGDDRGGASEEDAPSRAVDPFESLDPRELVHATFVSDGFHEFMLNWHAHVKRLGIRNVVVAALDEATYATCARHAIACYSHRSLRYTHGVVATGGSPLHDANASVTLNATAFQQIGALKTQFLLTLLKRGLRVLVSDVDVVWLRDPAESYFDATDGAATAAAADIAVSTDCLSAIDEAKTRGCWHMQFNTGIMYVNPTETAMAFVTAWGEALRATTHAFEHDQDVFNRLLRTAVRSPHTGPHTTAFAW